MSQLADIEVSWNAHPDAHGTQDEWFGVTDPAVRRKLQNRLNQRAARRRKAFEKHERQADACSDTDTNHSSLVRSSHSVGLEELTALYFEPRRTIELSASSSRSTRVLNHVSEMTPESYPFNPLRSIIPHGVSLSEYTPTEVEQLWRLLLLQASSRAQYPLPADHLLSLIYYNVYRGFITNIGLLNLDFPSMCRDRYVSPFVGKSPSDPSFQRIPPGLRPTSLQCTILHHPMWDLFPDPILRDNALVLDTGQQSRDEEICLDLCGDGTPRGAIDRESNSGMIVWGDPWDIDNWEVTEAFAQKWNVLMKNAFRLLISTNEHRRHKGKRLLSYNLIRED